MQGDQHFYPRKVVPPLAYQVSGSCMFNAPVAPFLGATLPPCLNQGAPIHGFEFQPSEVCPRNFIIFDQTGNKNRIMFHPALANKFSCPGFEICGTQIEDNGARKDIDKDNIESITPLKEDTEDINALLSLEEEEQEDGDVISTARTHGSYSSNSPDSCSTYGSKPSKRRLSSSIQNPFCGSGSSCNSETKRLRMKKMIKALRGIVPGGKQMSTVSVLDEAVRYLKSLKVEVKKLGIGNFKN
ncbi:PREDICTED: transcription factor bHLH144-like [Nelumbo nucifera]|uniref:Transcription factor bHLH144-like n=1 Tax=Nelumbo nucifera TaxID=4432 RepID=A0A1U8B3R9_NELNU|nr:PREDICTED: transcription factor bHLH144-like [Nelumbo nucifera]XP_010275483.2 PREDICTED: transcription factor bHLH144-like [Nelumbo nucifera]